MKIDKRMYVTPTAKAVEISAQAIICQSGGIGKMTVDPDDAGDQFTLE